MKVLSANCFEKGSVVDIELETKDLGPVTGIELENKLAGIWHPQQIIVKRGLREVANFDPKGLSLNCPVRCKMTLTKTDSDNPNDENPTDDSALSALLNDYSGGALSPSERNQLISLSCEDIVKGNENFGPNFPNNKPNFELILAKCPYYCHSSEALVDNIFLYYLKNTNN